MDTKILRHMPRVLQVVRCGAGSCLTPKSMILTTKQQCLLKCDYMMLAGRGCGGGGEWRGFRLSNDLAAPRAATGSWTGPH